MIKEAVLDIKLNLPKDTQIEALKNINDEFSEEYPIMEEIKETIGTLTIGNLLSASASSKSVGYSFKREDGKNIYHAGLNGFKFSRLEPYKDWKHFNVEAKKIWSVYRQKFEPTEIKRIALRYINLINIPESRVELDDYFSSSPEIPETLPQNLKHFLFRVTIPTVDIEGTANITQTIIEPQKKGCITVVLDIDVFVDHDLPKEDEDIWKIFSKLRDNKNKIFEAYITKKTRELFQ